MLRSPAGAPQRRTPERYEALMLGVLGLASAPVVVMTGVDMVEDIKGRYPATCG